MKPLTLFLLCLFIIGTASATITVNAIDVGTNFILWNWTPGLDLTDMYIDGSVMCGYETTDNLYLLTGLKANELHNITVYTAGDSGTNTTRTLNQTINISGAGDSEDIIGAEVPASPLTVVAAVLVAGIIIAIRREHLSPAMPDVEIKQNGDN
jgi:hypothetical protein